jgi:hypothetical protein
MLHFFIKIMVNFTSQISGELQEWQWRRKAFANNSGFRVGIKK